MSQQAGKKYDISKSAERLSAIRKKKILGNIRGTFSNRSLRSIYAHTQQSLSGRPGVAEDQIDVQDYGSNSLSKITSHSSDSFRWNVLNERDCCFESDNEPTKLMTNDKDFSVSQEDDGIKESSSDSSLERTMSGISGVRSRALFIPMRSKLKNYTRRVNKNGNDLDECLSVSSTDLDESTNSVCCPSHRFAIDNGYQDQHVLDTRMAAYASHSSTYINKQIGEDYMRKYNKMKQVQSASLQLCMTTNSEEEEEEEEEDDYIRITSSLSIADSLENDSFAMNNQENDRNGKRSDNFDKLLSELSNKKNITYNREMEISENKRSSSNVSQSCNSSNSKVPFIDLSQEDKKIEDYFKNVNKTASVDAKISQVINTDSITMIKGAAELVNNIDKNHENQVKLEKKTGRKSNANTTIKRLKKQSQMVGNNEKICEHSSTLNGITVSVFTKNQAERRGTFIRPEMEKLLKIEEKRKKRAKKLRESNEKCKRVRKKKNPGRKMEDKVDRVPKRRGRPTKTDANSKKYRQPNQQDTNIFCCLVERCCSVFGCIHGNKDNEWMLRKLPSLPDNMEYIFSEQQFYDNVKYLNEIQENHIRHRIPDANEHEVSAKKALVRYDKPRVIAGKKGSNGEKVLGFKVPLIIDPNQCSSDSESRGETGDSSLSTKSDRDIFHEKSAENLDNLIKNKPQIINDTILPKSAAFRLQAKAMNKNIAVVNSNTLTIEENNNDKKCFINDKDTQAVSYAQPMKKRRIARHVKHEDSSKEDSNVEKSRTELSTLFSGIPARDSASMRNGTLDITKSIPLSKKNNENDDGLQQGLKNSNEGEIIVSLTKKNLKFFNASNQYNNDQVNEPSDVVSKILSTMQPPSNSFDEAKYRQESRVKLPKKPENNMMIKRKRAPDNEIEKEDQLKENRELKRSCVLNDTNDNNHSNSNENEHSGLFSSNNSHCNLTPFAKSDKNQLIDAWLNHTAGSIDLIAYNPKDEESNHSLHSANTVIKSPPITDVDDTSINHNHNNNDNKESAMLHKGESDNSLNSFSCINNQEKIPENDENASKSSLDTINLTTNKTRVINETLIEPESRVEENDDYLFLDYEDDLSSHLSSEALQVENRDLKPAAITTSTSVTNDHDKNNMNERDQGINDEQEIDDNRSANELSQTIESSNNFDGYHQMSNFDRYASQIRREFNDQYYGYSMPNEPLRDEADDPYDPYEPVAESRETCAMHFPRDVRQFFRGLCFSYLKKGSCVRLECPFENDKYTVYLQNLPNAPCRVIETVLNHSLEQQYFHFLSDMFPRIIKRFDLRKIQCICMKIRDVTVSQRIGNINRIPMAFKFYQDSMGSTVDALLSKDQSPKTVISFLTDCFLFPLDENRKRLMKVVTKSGQITPGQHWETLESLIKPLSESPPEFVTKLILNDCKRFQKTQQCLSDVYEYIIKKTASPVLAHLDEGLLQPFNIFDNNNVIVPQEFNKEPLAVPSTRRWITFDTISSPNEDRPQNCENRNQHTTQRRPVKERLGPRPQLTALPEQLHEQPQPFLIPIGDLNKPKSIYGKYLWKLHTDLSNVQKSLQHCEYVRVIDTITIVKTQQDQPFAKGFYDLLCTAVLASAKHVEAIIKLSGNKFFRQDATGKYCLVTD